MWSTGNGCNGAEQQQACCCWPRAPPCTQPSGAVHVGAIPHTHTHSCRGHWGGTGLSQASADKLAVDATEQAHALTVALGAAHKDAAANKVSRASTVCPPPPPPAGTLPTAWSPGLGDKQLINLAQQHAAPMHFVQPQRQRFSLAGRALPGGAAWPLSNHACPA